MVEKKYSPGYIISVGNKTLRCDISADYLRNGSRGTSLRAEKLPSDLGFVQLNGLTPPQGVVVQPRQSGKNEFPPIPARF